jgi:hypothetical protein
VKYLVDNIEVGELGWVFARTPREAAATAVLPPFSPPQGSYVMVYDLPNGWLFPFWFV